MLRRAVSSATRFSWRAISSSTPALEGEPLPAGPKEFVEQWTKIAPSTLPPPDLPSDFLPPFKEGESQADGDKFPLNFYTPSGVLAEVKVDQVVLPGVEGYFGVKANHVPYIAQLKPGLVELHDGTEVSKYFISGGFAFMHVNSVLDVCVTEAGKLDTFDPAAVKAALTAASQAQGGEDFEAGMGRVAAELYQALDAALEAK